MGDYDSKRLLRLNIIRKVKKTGPGIKPVKALVQRFRGPTGLTGVYIYIYIYIYHTTNIIKLN